MEDPENNGSNLPDMSNIGDLDAMIAEALEDSENKTIGDEFEELCIKETPCKIIVGPCPDFWTSVARRNLEAILEASKRDIARKRE